MDNKVYIVAVLILWTCCPADAVCTCKYLDLQTKLCKSDFALVGRIVSRKPTVDGPRDHLEYTATAISIIKGRISTTFVFQAPKTSSCGVEFPVRSIQFLMGKRSGGKFVVTSCEVNGQNRPFTTAQWTYLFSRSKRNSYVQQCDCEIIIGRDTPAVGDFCRLVGDGKNQTCYMRNALCRKVGSQGSRQCSWINGEACG